jgi:hypothetical protein
VAIQARGLADTDADGTRSGGVSPKTEFMRLRLQLEERQAFEQAAVIAGVPLSAWARERLRRAARMELVDAGRHVPFIKYKDRTDQ